MRYILLGLVTGVSAVYFSLVTLNYLTGSALSLSDVAGSADDFYLRATAVVLFYAVATWLIGRVIDKVIATFDHEAPEHKKRSTAKK